MKKIRLTSFSPGAGCGCKISPAVLKEILKVTGGLGDEETGRPGDEETGGQGDWETGGQGDWETGRLGEGEKGRGVEGLKGGGADIETSDFRLKTSDFRLPTSLLVGNETSDDAAVFDLGNGTAVISTTDFFMPICDDAYDFGRIASANAISDVYAMGGKPLMAISILGWPVEKLPVELARQVLEGSRAICREAGIPLAGGHSIDSLEPIFGLAVTGIVNIANLKQNNTAQDGDSIFITKPLGVGVLSTAQKKDLLKPEHVNIARDSMIKLNSAGYLLGQQKGVTAMTDVTGFGLLGHLIEICEGSGLSARINFQDIPVFPETWEYIALEAVPGGTKRNWKSYGHKTQGVNERFQNILCDPQTNGGLLITGKEEEIRATLNSAGLTAWKIGEMGIKKDFSVYLLE